MEDVSELEAIGGDVEDAIDGSGFPLTSSIRTGSSAG
jgi:hypothetical protein